MENDYPFLVVVPVESPLQGRPMDTPSREVKLFPIVNNLAYSYDSTVITFKPGTVICVIGIIKHVHKDMNKQGAIDDFCFYKVIVDNRIGWVFSDLVEKI